MIKSVVSTEKAADLLERQKTVVFVVDLKADKREVKRAVEEFLGVKVVAVRTVISPKGVKKAYVRLDDNVNVDEVSAKLRIV
jgi:large subunit ribosomal protein L23